ncbi:hypothetical protein DMB66_23140 [Actinoplanes sp. ATCC 53533]|nr:hypothetical protein DMB66_23140 [Actinoplanes sp. ATCC 53533]
MRFHPRDRTPEFHAAGRWVDGSRYGFRGVCAV